MPSRKDRERSYGAEVVNYIISLKDGKPVVRGWWLTADAHREADWDLVDDV